MKFIIGLGNPGERHVGTRHNLGFMVLDEYAKKHLPSQISWEKSDKFKAYVLDLSLNIKLIKPQTFMNNSGMGVKAVTTYFKINPSDIIVVHDDLDLPLGKIKVRKGGSGAGHHGVESIIDKLGTDDFIRVRLGIGNLQTLSAEHKEHSINVEHYVLEQFMAKEKSTVKRMIKLAVGAIDTLLEDGLEKAQNQHN